MSGVLPDRFAGSRRWGMHMNAITPRFEALMFPTPKPALTPNTYAYESSPLVKPTGFREYDARWLLEKEINLMGVQALGMGLGKLIAELGVKPDIVTGHDLRHRSAALGQVVVRHPAVEHAVGVVHLAVPQQVHQGLGGHQRLTAPAAASAAVGSASITCWIASSSWACGR